MQFSKFDNYKILYEYVGSTPMIYMVYLGVFTYVWFSCYRRWKFGTLGFCLVRVDKTLNNKKKKKYSISPYNRQHAVSVMQNGCDDLSNVYNVPMLVSKTRRNKGSSIEQKPIRTITVRLRQWRVLTKKKKKKHTHRNNM